MDNEASADVKKRLDEIEDALRDYDINYDEAKNGKNQKVRDTAQKMCDNAKTKIKSRIFKNEELSDIWLEKYKDVYSQDEFFYDKYFSGDMDEFIKIVKEKII